MRGRKTDNGCNNYWIAEVFPNRKLVPFISLLSSGILLLYHFNIYHCSNVNKVDCVTSQIYFFHAFPHAIFASVKECGCLLKSVLFHVTICVFNYYILSVMFFNDAESIQNGFCFNFENLLPIHTCMQAAWVVMERVRFQLLSMFNSKSETKTIP